MPQRIQLRRTKGWRKPEGAVVVSRPSKWGNLWRVGLVSCGCRSVGECTHNRFRCETAAEAVEAYRTWMDAALAGDGYAPTILRRKIRLELRGKDIACWCALDAPCHGDVLLEIANKEETAS